MAGKDQANFAFSSPPFLIPHHLSHPFLPIPITITIPIPQHLVSSHDPPSLTLEPIPTIDTRLFASTPFGDLYPLLLLSAPSNKIPSRSQLVSTYPYDMQSIAISMYERTPSTQTERIQAAMILDQTILTARETFSALPSRDIISTLDSSRLHHLEFNCFDVDSRWLRPLDSHSV